MAQYEKLEDTAPSSRMPNHDQGLWLTFIIRKALKQPLSSAVSNLSGDDARYMVSFIEGMDDGVCGPLHHLLFDMGLPPLVEGEGFWAGEVLPLLRKKLAPKPTYPTRATGESFKDVKGQVDIADIAGRYTELRPSGSRLKGLCPLHTEESPSFVVYADTQSFYCFGCSRGGDVIELTRLLMEQGRW